MSIPTQGTFGPTSFEQYEKYVPEFRDSRLLELYTTYLGIKSLKGKKICFIGDGFTSTNGWPNYACSQLGAVNPPDALPKTERVFLFPAEAVMQPVHTGKPYTMVSQGCDPDIIVISMGMNDAKAKRFYRHPCHRERCPVRYHNILRRGSELSEIYHEQIPTGRDFCGIFAVDAARCRIFPMITIM